MQGAQVATIHPSQFQSPIQIQYPIQTPTQTPTRMGQFRLMMPEPEDLPAAKHCGEVPKA